MKLSLKIYNRPYGWPGTYYRACLSLHLETDDEDLRLRVAEAIKKAIAPPEREKERKLDTIGFVKDGG